MLHGLIGTCTTPRNRLIQGHKVSYCLKLSTSARKNNSPSSRHCENSIPHTAYLSRSAKPRHVFVLLVAWNWRQLFTAAIKGCRDIQHRQCLMIYFWSHSSSPLSAHFCTREFQDMEHVLFALALVDSLPR